MCDFEQDTPINEPECGYLSEAELDAMTVEELEAALALALDSMTEETYDGDVISRYLDALERKAPMPPVPDVDASYSAFLQKMQAFTPERRTRNRWKRPGRVLLAAILAVIAVFGSLFTAQALGADVFGNWHSGQTSFLTLDRCRPRRIRFSGIPRPALWMKSRVLWIRWGKTVMILPPILPYRMLWMPMGFQTSR